MHYKKNEHEVSVNACALYFRELKSEIYNKFEATPGHITNFITTLFYSSIIIMPKVRRSKKKPPEGWELIEPTLEELNQKMREGRRGLYNITCYSKSCPLYNGS